MDPTVAPLPSPPSRTRRAMAFVRRWLSAAAGLGMLIVTVSGMLLPHQGGILHVLNPTVSTRDAGSGQDSLPQAVETIKNAHPDEPVLSARWDTDVVEVRTEQATYTVNPATGHETSRASATPVWISVLDNLHRCLLSCRGPGPGHRAASRRRRRAGGRRWTGGRPVPASAERPVVDVHGLGRSRRTARPGAVPRRRRGEHRSERRPRNRTDHAPLLTRPPADHTGGLAPMTPMPTPEYVPVPTSQDRRRSGLWSQTTRRWGHNRTRTAPE